jgi:hypothetical protein
MTDHRRSQQDAAAVRDLLRLYLGARDISAKVTTDQPGGRATLAIRLSAQAGRKLGEALVRATHAQAFWPRPEVYLWHEPEEELVLAVGPVGPDSFWVQSRRRVWKEPYRVPVRELRTATHHEIVSIPAQGVELRRHP